MIKLREEPAIVFTLAVKLPDPYWLVSFVAVFFMLPVQACANRVNTAAAPSHDPNSRFSAWNWVGVVLGGAFFALVAIGLSVPNQ